MANVKEDADYYISDESSFYGDEDAKAELERRATEFCPSKAWREYLESMPGRLAMARAAARAAQRPPTLPQAPLYNPYESQLCARQLAEDVPSFLARLPPSATRKSDLGPWIYIANPYSGKRPLREDWAGFTDVGQRRLDRWLAQTSSLRKDFDRKPEVAFRAAHAKLRAEMEGELRRMASERNCTSGKWMLFVPKSDVDRIWSAVAHATANHQLGTAAKVSTAPDDPPEELNDPQPTKPEPTWLICIYTADFNDLSDVTRVLEQLKQMHLVNRSRSIFYKCDAYTHLGLYQGNAYGLPASLYLSKELLDRKEKDKKK